MIWRVVFWTLVMSSLVIFGGCGVFCKSKKGSSKPVNQETKSDSPDEIPPDSSSQVGEAPKHRAPDQEEIDRQKEELLKEKRKNRPPENK